ncbi:MULTISPECIES: nucleotidyltransferase family protein [unclassified Actinoplanes]|uniref:nucleotidyltransferase family protein n=1 Tax=unclassified Actinoplanes TaxID=2626549 RepID=UPI00031965E1|nr:MULTISPECIES: nucleotidyltransferase family protein [unclassified Actinoplanes]
MEVDSERDVVALIESDPAAMRVLHAAATLALPDWWIGAGFVRNRVWDAITGRPPSPERDVDLAYYAPDSVDPADDARAEAHAAELLPGVPWEIRNQARMHLRNGDAPYTSTLDAIAHWVETATCAAVTLRAGTVHLAACHGLTDLTTMVVRPAPSFDNAAGHAAVRARVEAKGWLRRWPTLRLELGR